MKTLAVVAALLVSMSGQVLADINTSACGSPFVQRDFDATAATIYYGAPSSSGSGSGGGAGTYRICALKSAIRITLANANGAQIVEPLGEQACMDVSSSQISISVNPPATSSSVIYCKIG